MTFFSAFCDKPGSPPSRRSKRDPAAIRQAMLSRSDLSAAGTGPGAHPAYPDQSCEDVGLPLGKLEDERWSVSPPVAREILENADLPYEGRRAGNIYRWQSIFRAEGLNPELVKNATRQSHPYLFDDLIDSTRAAELLGYKDSSSIRKLVASGQMPENSFVRFGSRGVYRFRPEALQAMRKTSIIGRII